MFTTLGAVNDILILLDVLPHVQNKGWSAQLVEDVLKDIILRDSQNARRMANQKIKASGGVVKRGRKPKLRHSAGATDSQTPNSSTFIPMADPNYIQGRTLATSGAEQQLSVDDDQNHHQREDRSTRKGKDTTEQSGLTGIVASQTEKRAGMAPIQGAASPSKKRKTEKSEKQQQPQHSGSITGHGATKPKKTKQNLPSVYVLINNAYIVLQQTLSFRKWSSILDENSRVEDIRRKPIYFYRRIDGSVGTISEPEDYQDFLSAFRDCQLMKNAHGAIEIDRVRAVSICSSVLTTHSLQDELSEYRGSEHQESEHRESTASQAVPANLNDSPATSLANKTVDSSNPITRGVGSRKKKPSFKAAGNAVLAAEKKAVKEAATRRKAKKNNELQQRKTLLEEEQ
jgi:hypothetical protein